MRLSLATEYALQIVLDLAMQRHENIVRISEIAKRQKIPPKFLHQILLILKGGGIVASQRGINGGYFLTKRPSKITLASIVFLTSDFLGTGENRIRNSKEFEQAHPFQEIWADIDDYILRKLEKTTIGAICERIRATRSSNCLHYFI